jgi:hypothetical protein
MPQELGRHDRPGSEHPHPRIYAVMVGLLFCDGNDNQTRSRGRIVVAQTRLSACEFSERPLAPTSPVRRGPWERQPPLLRRTGALHSWQRHDLDDFYPCARHLQMGMVLAEYLGGDSACTTE